MDEKKPLRQHRVALITETKVFNYLLSNSLPPERFSFCEFPSDEPDLLDKIAAQSVSVVVIKSNLRADDGFTLCRTLKSPARDSRADVVKMRSLGVQNVIAKPFGAAVRSGQEGVSRRHVGRPRTPTPV